MREFAEPYVCLLKKPAHCASWDWGGGYAYLGVDGTT